VTAERHNDPLPPEVLDKLRRVSTSTLATQLYKRGFRQPSLIGVRPLSQAVDGFVGEAFTMRFIPAREDVNTLDPYRSGNTLQWESIESVPPAMSSSWTVAATSAPPPAATCS
jgi:regulator of RNase E activity RraA